MARAIPPRRPAFRSRRVAAGKHQNTVVTVLGGGGLSESQSTLTAAAWAPSADGVTTDAITFTAKDSGGNVLAGQEVTFTVETVSLSASLSEVTALPSAITNDGVDDAVVTIRVRDEDGYDAPGIAASAVVLAVSGASNTVTQPAAATNANGITSGSFVTTQAATKTASATVAGLAITDTAAVEASGTPSLLVPMMTSSWSAATGTTSTAIGDGGTFDTLTADYALCGEVIAAPGGIGWLSTNVLRVESDAIGTRNGYLETRHTTLGEIAEGEVRNFRWGMAVYHPEAQTDNSHHGIQDGTPSGSGTDQNWNLTDGTNFVGTWEPNWLLGGNSSGPGRYYIDSTTSPTRLDKEVKYTFECQMERGSGANTNAFQFRAWIYDSDGTLLYGPSDFKSANYSGETLATSRWNTFNNRAGTAAIAFGCNGMIATWPCHYSDQSEIAIVSSADNPGLTLGTPIGPYGSVDGE